MQEQEAQAQADMAKAAAHSIINGRQLTHDDPAVRAFEAEQRGGGDGNTLKGNLFARSAWLHFTLAQLDRRGMLTDAEMERTHDQGICMPTNKGRVRLRQSGSR